MGVAAWVYCQSVGGVPGRYWGWRRVCLVPRSASTWAGVVLYGWLYERLASVLVLGLEVGLPCPPVGQQHLGPGVANIKQGSLLMQFLEWTPIGVVVLCTQILVVVLP